MISRTLLVASSAFGGLSAQRVAAAISRGLTASGFSVDQCPLETEGELPAEVRALLGEVDFDARMRRARCVILAQRRLHERTLAGSLAFEIATRARQGGVPAYAMTAESTLDAFDARILDLQLILEASSARALEAAARRLAELV
jgi:glycerate kinase